MNQQLTLCKAGPDSLDWAVALFARATVCLDSEGIRQWDGVYPSRTWLEGDVAAGELYLFRDGERPVGVAALNEQQAQEYQTVNWVFGQGRVCVIHRFCIDPDTQGKGYGKKAMGLLEQQARALGYERMRLDAFKHNPVSNHLYRALGYREAGEVVFRKGTCICYEKQL